MLCPRCGGVLDPVYKLDSLRASVSLDSILTRRSGVWRWREFLPVTDERCHIDIGAGASPLIECLKLSRWIGACVYVKYEGQQPTGSLKDHSFAVAVSKAELYPTLAFGYLSPSIGLAFLLGLLAVFRITTRDSAPRAERIYYVRRAVSARHKSRIRR